MNTENLNQSALKIITLVELRKAFEQGQFFLAFQPRKHLVTGKISGLEALVRWNHPRAGVIPCGLFLEFAEKTGFIKDLDRWAICEALNTMNYLKEIFPRSRIAVNISDVTLEDPKFGIWFEEKSRDWKKHLPRLELDFSVSNLDLISPAVVKNLEIMKRRDVALNLDNFGQGKNDFQLISELDPNEIKICPSCIKDITISQSSQRFLQRILSYSNLKGIQVCAKGVESQEQAVVLSTLGCHNLQGFHYSHPLTLGDLVDFLAAS